MFKKLLAVAMALGLGLSNVYADSILINGAGATFPYPIYSKWFSVYQSIDPSVRFNYQSIGSGGGVKQISAMTVDFGATDGPMTTDELKNAEGGQIFHIPMVAGAVVVVYNLDGVGKGLKLTADDVAGIFLGDIKSWNDPKLAQSNPGVTLPNTPIVVVHRSDGSGTTNIFTDYLTSVSTAWKAQVGVGKSVSWPVGLGGKGNEGVTGLVKQTPGSIGYVELAYADKNNLAYASIQNKAGNFIEPSLEATSAAIAGKLSSMPKDFRVSIVNPDGANAYSISGFTWILIYKNQKDPVRGKAVLNFLKWAIHDGQKYAAELGYAPLPNEIIGPIEEKLAQVTV